MSMVITYKYIQNELDPFEMGIVATCDFVLKH